MVVANNEIDEDKNYASKPGIFDHRITVQMQRCDAMAHCPMGHIPGFTRSHCMLPLGECLHRIAPAAAMVNEFVVKHKTLTNHNF